MISAIKKMLDIGPATDFAQLMQQGAIIIDVRSKGEFDGGHIKGALNLPLDQLQNNLNKLKDKNKCIITCCASGMRSASARALLTSKGYTAVYNGGGWSSLQNKL
jgi:rhodanese-related sulfurtransferase